MVNITKDEFKLFAEMIEEDCGIHLRDEKQSLLEGRLQNLLLEMGFDNFTDFYRHLQKDKTRNTRCELIDRITTNHTYFMREATHFHFMKSVVLPEFKQKIRDRDLRIWSAASSSGEEAYTLAMLIDDYFGEEKKLWDTKILATDISKKVIKKAHEGIYNKEQITNIPPNWKMQYFKNIDKNKVELIDKIKKEVIFREFNLMNQTYPFKKKFHIIFCRNVMIYFEEETKNKLVKKLYDSLDKGGYLFIGHSEAINKEAVDFKYVCPSVYRKEE